MAIEGRRASGRNNGWSTPAAATAAAGIFIFRQLGGSPWVGVHFVSVPFECRGAAYSTAYVLSICVCMNVYMYVLTTMNVYVFSFSLAFCSFAIRKRRILLFLVHIN